MEKQAYIFIGQSGCGKGTQANLLANKIKEKYSAEKLIKIETGSIFRQFTKGETLTAKKTKEYIDNGKLPPAFIGIHSWSHQLISSYNNENFILIDGTPRISMEVPVLVSAAKFYDWKLNIIYLEISDEISNQRLKDRGREDDLEELDRQGRISWFKDDVLPAISELKNRVDINFYTIDGEKAVMEIHEEILSHIKI